MEESEIKKEIWQDAQYHTDGTKLTRQRPLWQKGNNNQTVHKR